MDFLNESNIPIKIRSLNYYDLLIFIIPFFIFLYYLHVFNPGLLGFDSFNQLHQIASGKFNNWHPFFHTFIEMLCLKLYGNTVSIAILQIITFSTMWMIICKYNRNDNQNNKTFILQIIITLIISLIPINAIYSITLLKDILFSYFLMFLCFLIKVLIDKKGHVSFTFIIVISIVMAVIAQIRLNGIYIIIPILFFLGYYLYRKNKTNKWYIIIPILTIIFILLIASLNVIYDVEDDQKDFVFVKTTHMLVDYDLNLDLDDADRGKIHKIIPENKINESYSIYYSDSVFRNSNFQVFDNDKSNYIGLAIKYSIENPMHFLFYLFKSSDIVWDITRDYDWTKANGEVYFTNTDEKRENYYGSHSFKPITNFDNVSSTNVGTDEYKSLNSWVNYAKDNILLDTLFNSPALYMYLSIIIMIILFLITKLKDIWLVYLPNILNIGTIFISVPAQQNRYLYPNLLVFYLLIIILIGILTTDYKENIA